LRYKPKNTLRTKLFRDMSRAAMQFISIILLCALGTFAFSALDGTARMMQGTLDVYFEENQLADFWITVPSADRAALDKVRAVPGVKTLRARASTDLETAMDEDVSVSVTAYDGDMAVNMPLLREGSLLDPADKRGCLMEERFAAANGFSLDDRTQPIEVLAQAEIDGKGYLVPENWREEVASLVKLEIIRYGTRLFSGDASKLDAIKALFLRVVSL